MRADRHDKADSFFVQFYKRT